VLGSTNVTLSTVNINNVVNGLVVMGACTQRAAGGCGTQRGSWNVAFSHSEIGYTGLESSSWVGGNRTTLTQSGFTCENNEFHDFGRWTMMYNPGVSASGVGTVVRKNEFYSSYHVRGLLAHVLHLLVPHCYCRISCTILLVCLLTHFHHVSLATFLLVLKKTLTVGKRFVLLACHFSLPVK
jgi:hypothetical protein